jgi:nitrogenase molybdenum-iron protein beta chain
MGGLAIPCSGVQEKEIVFGGDRRLDEQLKATVEIAKAGLFVVLTGCMTEMVGDDVDAVVAPYQAQGVPFVTVSTGGFKGTSLLGYDLVLEALFRKFVTRGVPRQPKRVNLWGVPPSQDVFWAGNLAELRRLLEALGLSVNTFFTLQDTLADLRGAASAELNIVVSPIYGVGPAIAFEEEHGTPYVALDFPVGALATRRFLEQVAVALKIDGARVQAVVEREEREYYHFLSRALDSYNDIDLQRFAVVIGNVNYAPALTDFAFRELGWLPELVVITDILNEEQALQVSGGFAALLPELAGKLVYETNTSRVIEHFRRAWPTSTGRYRREFSPSFVLGSTLDKEFADEIKAAHLAISYPVTSRQVLNRAYAGYRGGLTLVEDIFSSLLTLR